MRNIEVHFNGKANFGQVQAELAAVATQMKAVNEYANKMSASSGGGMVNVKGYRESINMMQKMRREFGDAIASTGQFNIQQHRAISGTEEMTKRITKTQASFKEMFAGGRAGFKQMTKDIAAQQALMARAQVQHWGTDARGRTMADIITPRDINNVKGYAGSLEEARREQAALGEAIRSGGTQMVNQGKNMQWTGRQISMGLTLPIVAFGAVSGKLAYDIDEQMGRIAKVYDTASQSGQARAQELEQVEAKSMDTAKNAAKEYGVAMTDTLDVTGQLAAVGLKGSKLQASTNEVMRLATLGEMDHAKSLDATIAMQNIFKQSTKETAEAINYMNTVENQTSLSMEDFATAIPIAAKPVQAFGGDIDELGTLLVAMKSQGIDAASGANAIKGAVGRLAAPSKEASKVFRELTGVDYSKLMKQNEGDIVGMFQAIDKATKNLGRNEKIQVFDKLFGKYQLTRMTAMMDGLRGVGDASTQVGKAVAAAGDSQRNAASASQELAQMQERSSFKIKAAWELVKAELGDAGKPFLDFGADVLNVVGSIVSGFNSLPGVIKKSIATVAGIGALVGPILMAAGIGKQLGGVAATGLGSMMKWRSGYSNLTTEQAMNNKMREASIGVVKREGVEAGLTAKQYEAIRQASHHASQAVVQDATARQESLIREQQLLIQTQQSATKRKVAEATSARDVQIAEAQKQAAIKKTEIIQNQATAAASAGAKFQMADASSLSLMGNNRYYNQDAKRFATSHEVAALAEMKAIDSTTQRTISAYKGAATKKQAAYAAETSAFTKSAVLAQERSQAQIAAVQSQFNLASFGSQVGAMNTPVLGKTTAISDLGKETDKVSGKIGGMSSKMQGFIGYAGLAAASLATMAVSGNKTVDVISQMVLMGSMMLPTFGQIGPAMKTAAASGKAAFASTAASIRGTSGVINKTKTGLKGLGTGMVSVAGKAGLIGTAIAAVGIAGGVGLKILNDKLGESDKKIKMLNNTAKDAADVFKYQYKEPEIKFKIPTFEGGSNATNSLSQLEKIKDKYGDVIDEMSEMSSKEKYRVAMNIALDARRTGASAKQASKLARSLLESAASDQLEARALVAKVPLEVELQYSPNSLQFQNITGAIKKGLNDSWDIGKGEGIKNVFLPSDFDDMSDDAEQQAKDSAKDIAEALKNAPSSAKGIQFITDIDNQMRAQMAQVVDGLSKETKEKIKALGFDLSNRGEIQKALDYIDEQKGKGISGGAINIDEGDLGKLKGALEYQKQVAQETGKAMGATGDEMKSIISLQTALNIATNGGMLTREQGEKEYASILSKVVKGKMTVFDKTDDINKAEQLSNLNQIRVAMGLKATGTLQDGLNKKVTKAYQETKKVTDETKRAKDETSGVAGKWQQVVDQLGGAKAFGDWFSQESISSITDSMSEMAESASSSFDEQMQASMDNLEESQEVAMDAFDDRRERGAAQLDRRLEQYQARREAGLAKIQRQQEKYEAERERGLNAIEKEITKYENERAKGLEQINKKIQDLDKLQDQFDKKWEKKEELLNKRFDERADKLDLERSKLEERQRVIEKQIDIEQKAEDKRQANFEREISRIQRLAETANRNIDFNVALKSGDLDEAAKIQNDADAQAQKNALEAAAAASQKRSDRKIEGFEGQSSSLDERLNDIDKEMAALERARKRAMERFEKIKRKQQQLLDQQIRVQRRLLREEREAYKEETRMGMQRLQRKKQEFNRETQMGIRMLEKEKKRYERQTALGQKHLEKLRAQYDKQTESQRNALQKQQDAERNAAQKRWETRKKYLDKEMDAILAFTPRSMKEARKQVGQIEKLYGKYGIKLEKSGAQWSKSIYDSLVKDLNAARHNMEAESKWKSFGVKIANGTLKAFGISLGEFKKWGKTGKAPKNFEFRDSRESGQHGGGGKPVLHTGGVIGETMGGRPGFSGGMKSQEVPMTGLKGEGVINKRGMAALGKDNLAAINRGRFNSGSDSPTDIYKQKKQQSKLDKKMSRGGGKSYTGGRGMASASGDVGAISGMVGAMAAQMAGAKVGNASINKMIISAITAHMGLGTAKPGVYGEDGMHFNAEQLRNAYTIAQVGDNMGFGARDIQIALMAAMVESGLVNVHYGDRDSLGLFQQRASWGSAEERTTPSIAAKLFFNALRAVPNRKDTPMGDVAQDVQVSAFPDRYQGYKDEAIDIYNAMMASGGGTYGGGLNGSEGSGGWHKPLKHISWSNSHDLSAAIGTPAYAVNDGKIVESRMITSGTVGSGNVVPGAASYGITTVLRTGGADVRYAHGDYPYQKHTLPVGSSVRGGAHIFDTGSSGNVTGPHLHMDINGAEIASSWLGARVPGMKVGGKTISGGLAELHEKEIVLTEPLSAKLERGISKLDKTGGSQYNDHSSVTVNIETGDLDVGNEQDRKSLAKDIRKALQYEDSRVGRGRKITGK